MKHVGILGLQVPNVDGHLININVLELCIFIKAVVHVNAYLSLRVIVWSTMVPGGGLSKFL